MDTPETINIEKYAKALNNLVGVDSAYYRGDKDVDAIVEVIIAAKKLENKVNRLAEANDKANVLLAFIEYLKDHSFVCDPGNGFSFDAIDVDELDGHVKDFLEVRKRNEIID